LPVSEQTSPVPAFWPSATDLAARADGGGLVFLPDDVREVDGQLTASFRESAQNPRLRAQSNDIPVEFVTPPDAQLGMYRERAAAWVLPWILSVPSGVVIGLIVNELQRAIDRARSAKQAIPSVRFREVIIENGRTTARELSGSAEELRDLLASRLAERPLDLGE
jgi:hypothetical protein